MTDKLPKHDDFSLASRALSATSIAVASVLLASNVYRIIASPIGLVWWLIPVALAGMLAADFVSGIVHWAADTWGSERMPLIGRRFLHPFRVHHVNPDDFLERRFIDANGDIALLILPVLALAHLRPLDHQPAVTEATFLVAFSGVALFTNQFHQWAHMLQPPLVVRMLQRSGLILGREAHAQHHRRPYDANYCIATGWCNRPLAAIGFFRGVERGITRLTGLQARQDDEAFEKQTAGIGLEPSTEVAKSNVG